MKRIIENPNPVLKEYKATCEKCGCIFSYEQEDWSNDWNGIVGPGSCGGPHTTCPNCGERVYTKPCKENLLRYVRH